MPIHWRERASDAIAERGTEVSRALTQALHAANDAFARGRDSGLDHARAFGLQALDHTRRAGRSTRSLVAGHPLEAVLLAGLAGVVIGWMLHHTRSPARAARATGSKPAARRPTQRRSGSRSATSRSP